MDTYPIAASSLERYYYTDGHQLERQYKEHLSGYEDWEEQEHADKWLVFPDNIGPNMSIDETSLSDGELYTVVSNKDAHGRKGALAAIVWGTKAEVVAEALRNIPLEKRQLVEEITLDLSPSMRSIVQRSFPKTRRTIDRFHIQQLASDAIQEIRIGHRWEALKADHKRKLGDPDTGEILPPEIFPNGDSRPQLLARSRYLLFKSYEKWTDSQKARAKILFKEYPDIKLAYDLAERLRQVFSKCPRRSLAATRLAKWYRDVEESGFDSFRVIARTFFDNEQEILNGTFTGSLIDHVSERQCEAYRRCARLSEARIYRSRPVLDVELSGYKIMETLMQQMVEAVIHPDRYYSKQLIGRVSSQYHIDAPDLETRLMAVIDYISGMTDVYALDVYQKINGISLPII